METKKVDLGKVSITPAGPWRRDKSYERLDLVYCKYNNSSYIAKQDVPANIDIINEKYWQLVVNNQTNFDEYKIQITNINNEILELKNKVSSHSNNIETLSRGFTNFANTTTQNINNINNSIRDINNKLDNIETDTGNSNNGYILNIDVNDTVFDIIPSLTQTEYNELRNAINNNSLIIINLNRGTDDPEVYRLYPFKAHLDEDNVYLGFIYNNKIYDIYYENGQSYTSVITIDNSFIIPSKFNYVLIDK